MTKYFLKRGNEVKSGGWLAINKIDNNGENIRPICEMKRCMRKKRETSFNNMAMSSFGITIMFRHMWGSGKVGNTVNREKIFKSLVFSTILVVKSNDFPWKIVFYKSFEANKDVMHIRFSSKRVKPYVLCKMIYKDNIVFKIIMQ